MGGKCLGHGRATLFIREEEVAALGPILQKVLKLHHLAQFWQSGAPALFDGFHQMAMQAGKIQLVHSNAEREYGMKTGHAPNRKSVVWGKRRPVRVDHGGRRIINKKRRNMQYGSSVETK